MLNGLKKYGRRIDEIVVKNVIGAAGMFVWRSKLLQRSDGTMALADSTVERLYQQLISPEGKFGVLIQEFLPSILSEGEWSLVYFNKKYSHAVIKKPNLRNGVDAEEFGVQHRYGGHDQVVPDGQVPELLMCFGEKVLAALDEDLLHARVEVLLGEDQNPHLLELEVLDMFLFTLKPVLVETYSQAIMANTTNRKYKQIEDQYMK